MKFNNRKVLRLVTSAAFLFPLTFSGCSSSNLSNGEDHPDFYKIQPFEVFKNPIITNGADPWVVKHTDGYYYYTQTTGNNITIWKSETLSDLGNASSKVVWTPSVTAPNRSHLWAPELHYIKGKWYIYFAASDGDMGKQRMYVLVSVGDDPFGPYSHPEATEFGKITDPSDKWAIDGTVLEYKKKHYFIWSGWEGDVNVSQHLYIAEMKNPWTISGERIEISRPEFDWEKIGTPYINEGPQVLKNQQGDVFLIYSASGSWTDDYCLGMLTLTGKNPLAPTAWTKMTEPVFKKDPSIGVFGPGHNSFVKSVDDQEDWIVYHAAKFQGAGWNRNIRMQKFTWNDDGTPHFGTPVPSDTFIQVPSGESKGEFLPPLSGEAYLYEAELAAINQAKIIDNTNASGSKKVGNIDYEDSFVEFNIQVPPGEYSMVVRYSNGMGQQSSHIVSINDANIGEIYYGSHGWDVWQEAEKDVYFETETNKIRFSKGLLFAEIDRIVLIPKEVKTILFEAEHAISKNVKVVNDSLASNKQKVVYLDEAQSSLSFPILLPKAGSYEMKIHYSIGADSTSSLQLVINDDDKKSVLLESKSDKWQIFTTVVNLKQGANSIKLLNEKGLADIDHFTLTHLE